MTDTFLDASCVSCCASKPTKLWHRKVPEGMPLRGRLNIKVLRVPDLSERKSFFGWNHFLYFRLGSQRARTRLFTSARELKKEVYSFDLDGRSHFLKISAHTHTWLPCLANLLNGSAEISIHAVLENQGCAMQMYYKHRFHRLLNGSLRFQMWIDREDDLVAGVKFQIAKKDGQYVEHAQHPLEAWHRGAYDPVLSAWLEDRVKWVNNYWIDLGIYICNEHLFLGVFFAHHWHPLTHRSRVIVYMVSLVMGIFAIGIVFYSGICRVPSCADFREPTCSSQSQSGFNECISTYNGTIYCSEDIQVSCKPEDGLQGYQNIALGAFISYLLTKFLIFFAECKYAKNMPRMSGYRKCLENMGRCMVTFGVCLSLFLVGIGVYLTKLAADRNSNVTPRTFIVNFALQTLQASFYDLGFCVLIYHWHACWHDYVPLKFIEDSEFFALHPELGEHMVSPQAMKKNSLDKKKLKKKMEPVKIRTATGRTPPTPKTPKSDGTVGKGDLEFTVLEDARSPDVLTSKTKPMTNNLVNTQRHSRPNAFHKSMGHITGDQVENIAKKPMIKKLDLKEDGEDKKSSPRVKKLKVSVPSNARPGGLLKVNTPEGLSLLIRLPENVQPGISEILVDYQVHRKKQ